MSATKIGGATLLAAAAGFTIHVTYGRGWAEEYTQAAAQAGRITHVLTEPYPAWLVAVAMATALVPTFGKVIIYLLVRQKLPGQTAWRKGLAFSALLLLLDGETVRQPLMNTLVGLPLDVSLVKSLEHWVIDPVMGMLIALTVSWSSRKRLAQTS